MFNLHLLQNPQQGLLLPHLPKMLSTHRNPHTRRNQPRRRPPITQRNATQPPHNRLQRLAQLRQRSHVSRPQFRDTRVIHTQQNPRQFDMLHTRHMTIRQVPNLGKHFVHPRVRIPIIDRLETRRQNLTPPLLCSLKLIPALLRLALLRVAGIGVCVATMAVLEDVCAKDDEAVGPDGVFCGLEGAEGIAAFEGEGEGSLFHECGIDFLAEGDPEGGLAEAGLADRPLCLGVG